MKLCITVIDSIPEIPLDSQIFYEQDIEDLIYMLGMCKKTAKAQNKSLLITLKED